MEGRMATSRVRFDLQMFNFLFHIISAESYLCIVCLQRGESFLISRL